MSVNLHRVLQPLRVRYAAPLERGLSSFWSWWSGELHAMLPQRLQDSMARRRQKLFVELDGAMLRVRQGASHDHREILCVPVEEHGASGAIPLRDAQEIILLVPRDQVLTKSLSLPLAAEENLREVLAFEMDQHTPFQASKVYYDFVVTARSGSEQTLKVDLVYAPRAAVDNLLESVSRHRIEADVVTLHAADGVHVQPINLLPLERRRNQHRTVHRLTFILGAVCVLLLAAAIALPIAQKNTAIRELEAAVELAAAEAREGNKLRGDLEKMADASRFLATKKQSAVLVVQIIDELSGILPDHTWINRLDISAAEIQLQGQSTSSSSLISIIESSDQFVNARFRSPVVQIATTNVDRFQLSADIARSDAP